MAPGGGAGTMYDIWREYPVGTWTLIATQTLLSYDDPFSKTICTGTIGYKASTNIPGFAFPMFRVTNRQ